MILIQLYSINFKNFLKNKALKNRCEKKMKTLNVLNVRVSNMRSKCMNKKEEEANDQEKEKDIRKGKEKEKIKKSDEEEDRHFFFVAA